MRRGVLAGFLVTLIGASAPVPLAAEQLHPPIPPQVFYGSVQYESAALLDDAPVPDGTEVEAWENGRVVGRAVVRNGTWVLDVDPNRHDAVTFVIGRSRPSAVYDVSMGTATRVALVLSSGR